ncbi:MAG: S8 family peptidase, partial [Lapillicoccus sp.]
SYTYDATGSGVVVYLLDTGIRFSHVDFGGRATPGFDAINDGTAVNDCQGHGTHVAGTIGGSTYGVAKGVTLKSVRVLGCTGTGTDAQVIAGIDYVTGQKQLNPVVPAVANLSLGGATDGAALDAAVRGSIAAGVTYVIAAGNDSVDECATYSPADVTEAITVGATTKSDAQAFYSSFGPCLDVYAPGGDGLFSGIVSDSIASDTATTSKSGTSMATPHVSGAAALFLQGSPAATPAQVASWVTSNATPSKISSLGSGSPDLLLYTRLAATPPPSVGTTQASINGSATKSKKSWTATATMTVRDASSGVTVSGATVTVQLSSGATGTTSCTTGRTGTCSVSTSQTPNVPSVTYTVTDVAAPNTTWNGIRATAVVSRP